MADESIESAAIEGLQGTELMGDLYVLTKQNLVVVVLVDLEIEGLWWRWLWSGNNSGNYGGGAVEVETIPATTAAVAMGWKQFRQLWRWWLWRWKQFRNYGGGGYGGGTIPATMVVVPILTLILLMLINSVQKVGKIVTAPSENSDYER